MRFNFYFSDLDFRYQTGNTSVFEQLQLIDFPAGAEISGLNILFGPNGCGKSTLLQIFAGLLRPLLGQAQMVRQPQTNWQPSNVNQVSDHPVHSNPKAGNCFFLPDVPDWPYKTLPVHFFIKQVNFFLNLKQDSPSSADSIGPILSLLEIDHIASQKFDQLSRGQKKRLFLLWLWCQNFEQIYLDEPFADLDFQARKVLTARLIQLAENNVIWLAHHSLEEELLQVARIWFLTAKNQLILLQDSALHPIQDAAIIKSKIEELHCSAARQK